MGALFQVKNVHPDTGAPVTTSSLDDATATYTGNPVANAQALVAKAHAAGDFDGSFLDLSRQSISTELVAWVEGAAGSETLADLATTYLCNGDSMFHVNKGAIAFKMDAAENVRLTNTSVNGLVNLGHYGSTLCGDYSDGVSQPQATLHGYGGSAVRGYTFAGSVDVTVNGATARGLEAAYGSATGFDVMTDSTSVRIANASVERVRAGMDGDVIAPTAPPHATGFYVNADAGVVRISNSCATGLIGSYGAIGIDDQSGTATLRGICMELRAR